MHWLESGHSQTVPTASPAVGYGFGSPNPLSLVQQPCWGIRRQLEGKPQWTSIFQASSYVKFVNIMRPEKSHGQLRFKRWKNTNLSEGEVGGDFATCHFWRRDLGVGEANENKQNQESHFLSLSICSYTLSSSKSHVPNARRYLPYIPMAGVASKN